MDSILLINDDDDQWPNLGWKFIPERAIFYMFKYLHITLDNGLDEIEFKNVDKKICIV